MLKKSTSVIGKVEVQVKAEVKECKLLAQP